MVSVGHFKTATVNGIPILSWLEIGDDAKCSCMLNGEGSNGLVHFEMSLL